MTCPNETLVFRVLVVTAHTQVDRRANAIGTHSSATTGLHPRPCIDSYAQRKRVDARQMRYRNSQNRIALSSAVSEESPFIQGIHLT
jgi:hypothetical protein